MGNVRDGRAAAARVGLTFLLLTPFTLVTYLDGTDGQYDGDDEEQNPTHDTSRDRFVLHARRHREPHFVRALVAGR